MNSTTTLAERLVQMRTKRGLSQTTLAHTVGMSQQGYAALEAGTAKGSTYIARLARELGVSAYWLETGLGEQYDANSFTPEERLVIDVMRQMKPAKRKAFFDFVTIGKSK